MVVSVKFLVNRGALDAKIRAQVNDHAAVLNQRRGVFGGDVWIGEWNTKAHPVAELSTCVGVVFQEDACFPWLSVRDNVAFGLRKAGLDDGEKNRRVTDAIAMMGLGEFAGSYPAQLSGGMRQRVCIARTLVTKPRLLLLDEPFGALDQQTRLLMGDEVLRLWREIGATVFLITHALDEAAMLADRIAVMSARPGTVIDVVETRWPRERDSRIVERENFGAVTSRLWKTLREESMKTMGRTVAAP